MFTCLFPHLSKTIIDPLPYSCKFYWTKLSSLWSYREFHKNCRMDRRTRSYSCSTKKTAEMEFIYAEQIHMIERCYEHYRCRNSFDQSLQLVRHLRIKPQHTNSWKSVFIKFHCLLNYLLVSLSSFTYLPQSRYCIVWFCEALWVSVCEKTRYKFKFCCICMNRFLLKCPWGNAHIFIRRNILRLHANIALQNVFQTLSCAKLGSTRHS